MASVAQSDEPLGPNIVSASLDEVLVAANALGSDLSWAEVGPRVLPLLERVRRYPAGSAPQVKSLVPPGVSVSLAIDIGPAVMHILPEMLDKWSLTTADVLARALANVHLLAAEVLPADVHRDTLGGEPLVVLQTGRGIGSVLPLAPTELRRLFGPEPRLFMAPMRDLIFGLPPAEVELALWLYAEIAEQDPNHLVPLFFSFDGQALTVEHLGEPDLPATAGRLHA